MRGVHEGQDFSAKIWVRIYFWFDLKELFWAWEVKEAMCSWAMASERRPNKSA